MHEALLKIEKCFSCVLVSYVCLRFLWGMEAVEGEVCRNIIHIMKQFFFSNKFKARQAAIIFFEALLKSCLSANCISRLLTNTRYLCIEETVADPRGSLWQGSRCEVFGKTDFSGWCQVSRYKPFPCLTFLLRYLLFCDDDTFVAFDILSGFLSCVCNMEV